MFIIDTPAGYEYNVSRLTANRTGMKVINRVDFSLINGMAVSWSPMCAHSNDKRHCIPGMNQLSLSLIFMSVF